MCGFWYVAQSLLRSVGSVIYAELASKDAAAAADRVQLAEE